MYTIEVNCQIVIALLKAHGIHKVVANPGTTNVAFVGSVQNDPWFEVYSGVDERHSAYMAVGMAAESGEPVVLSCTGATASRNYIPALTEAFYRKIPILALTSSQVRSHLGQLHPQMIDRTQVQRDIAKISVECPIVKDKDDFDFCVQSVNRALLELSRHGGGPVHINMETKFSHDFNVEKLPDVLAVKRYTLEDAQWPEIPEGAKIAIWIGSHRPFDDAATAAIENFVRRYQAVVLMDKTSGYRGYGGIESGFLCGQGIRWNTRFDELKPNLLIHIGNVTGDYATNVYLSGLTTVWRVDEDGEIRNLLGNLENVFEMSPRSFFTHYANEKVSGESCLYNFWRSADNTLRAKIPELPFSNVWISGALCKCIPPGSILHMGILNSLRSCGMAQEIRDVYGFSNVGGFGIDGGLSSLVGASLVHRDKLYFGVFGDLSFFYNMNALGSRHLGKNLRILLVNNGQGGEFSLFGNPGAQFGEHTADFIAAGRHYGNKSKTLVRHYVTDLGFEYRSATSKDEYNRCLEEFVSTSGTGPMLLECFVEMKDEVDASKRISSIEGGPAGQRVRKLVGRCLPDGVKRILKSSGL